MENKAFRLNWVQGRIAELPGGSSLLDVGAGEGIYRPYAAHLEYLAQDLAEYDGKGNGKGLQTDSWDTSSIDIKCDLLDIPEDRRFDAVLCSEVLEHVPDPVAALTKISRLVKPGGVLILSAPFISMTHFAPYHYATGFSRYFYEFHLNKLGYEIVRIDPNGNYFDLVGQEVFTAVDVAKNYRSSPRSIVTKIVDRVLLATSQLIRKWMQRQGRKFPASTELGCFGWNVVARRVSSDR
ncbi:class I SAM-dependent methyltransferase [Devosia faecipullorum]|uniref:class I SAM-dependent methyltransferase n=1 Tax=Devosia faecipullorum TaxID=2755039 RepID=UPI00187B16DE|nr:class I SAM-dependent methyltransferase [Devosia faecipullorum]MBE7734533.1 class I SAM-dependent methyltransferase [Devosia faecipullorum]